jgi:NAD(P)-dependent dehydrogenase (short-subunit alcohol dehydrogenase family)
MKLEQGCVAVVTGAASGLGLALARAFAERRLDLVLSDVETDVLSDAVKTIGATGVSVIGFPADVRSASQVGALAAATLARFGRVDIICNNAGVTSHPTPMWEVEPNDWEWVLSVNLGGVINGIRAFVPHLIAQNSGHIVNTASMAGISVAPGLGPYLASKHAVVALSEGLALELAHAAPGVGVTVACPGKLTTNIQSAERNRPVGMAVAGHELTTAEMDALIQWSSTITGEDMSADAAAGFVIDAIESGLLHVAPNGLSAGVQAWTDRLLTDLA